MRARRRRKSARGLARRLAEQKECRVLETVRKHFWSLQSLLTIRRIEARRRARAFRFRLSQFLGQSAASVEPSQRAFDPPPSREDDEALVAVGSFDDLGFGLGQDAVQRLLEYRP